MVDKVIRTVLGDIPAETLGPCDYHDHLFQVSPILAGDELDDEQASGDEAAAMVAEGLTAMIEATPTGLGRNPSALARICERTSLTAVHATGAHHSGHYLAGHWLLEASTNDLVQRFTADIMDGLPDVATPADDGPLRHSVALTPQGCPVKAGIVKAGIGYWRINPFERRALQAAGETALTTGVPAMIHLDYGSAAWEVLEALEAVGLPAHRVVLAHIDRNLDPGLHAELTLAGAYLGYDGMARHREAPDSAIIDCIDKAIGLGADRDRILLGADVARRSRFISYGGMPGLVYLPKRFVPRLAARVGDALVTHWLTRNPARLLTIQNSA